MDTPHWGEITLFGAPVKSCILKCGPWRCGFTDEHYWAMSEEHYGLHVILSPMEECDVIPELATMIRRARIFASRLGTEALRTELIKPPQPSSPKQRKIVNAEVEEENEAEEEKEECVALHRTDSCFPDIDKYDEEEVACGTRSRNEPQPQQEPVAQGHEDGEAGHEESEHELSAVAKPACSPKKAKRRSSRKRQNANTKK